MHKMSSWRFISLTAGMAGVGTSVALDVAFLDWGLVLLLTSWDSLVELVTLWMPQLPVGNWGTTVTRRTV